MKRIVLVAAGISLAVCWCYPVFAQDVDLEKIVVTPSRIAQNNGSVARNVDVITSKDIAASGARDLSGVLEGVTSLMVSNYGGAGSAKTVRMRGSTSAETLVMVDGRPINSPRDGEVDLSSIPLDNVARVEVMHGAGSSLYGSNAMGGVINIITKRPPEKGVKTEVTSGFGTFRTYLDKIVHGARLGKLGYQLSGAYESSAGFRDNSKLNQKDLHAQFGYEFDEGNNLVFNSGFFHSLNGAPGSLSYSDTDDKQRTSKNFFDTWWDIRVDDGFGVKTRLYNSYERLEFMENSAGASWESAYAKDIHATIARGFDMQFDKKFIDIYRIVGGFNYAANYNDSTSSGKHAYSIKAWYFDNQFDITKQLFCSLGARLEDYSTFGFQSSPSASIMYRLDDKTKFRSSISRSFRSPTFNDLYWPDDGSTKGNANLKPEKGITGEIGVERQICMFLDSGLTYYHSQYKQMINWSETNWVWSPVNVGNAEINGIEFSNRLTFNENYSAALNYTWTRAKDSKTKEYLIYQPNNKADISLRYTNDRRGLIVEVNGHYVDRRFHDEANAIYMKRYFVFGLSGSKKINKVISCFASIDNLLNRDYQVVRDYPMPGFAINGGIKAEF